MPGHDPVVLQGQTFRTFGNDTVEIYVAESYYWSNPHTDKVVVRPKIYLTSVTAYGGSWSATLDASSFGLEAGHTVFTVSATDEQGNTSEFADDFVVVPEVAMELSGIAAFGLLSGIARRRR